MACTQHSGKSHRVQVGCNAFASGDSFGGATGALQCFRPQDGGFSFERIAITEPIPELNASIEQILSAGFHFVWNLSFVMDWDYRGNCLVLIMKDTPAASGASVPYTNVFELSNLRYFGDITGWYTSADGQTLISDNLTDCWVSSARFSGTANGPLLVEMSGLCKGHTHDPAEGALPSITSTTPVQMKQVTAMTIAGEAAQRLASFNINITQPSTEAEGYSIASSGSLALDFIDIAGAREVTVDAEIRSNEVAMAAVVAGVECDPFSITFNNGLATTLERELKIETGKLMCMKAPTNYATGSRVITSGSFQSTSQDGFDLKVTTEGLNQTLPLA